MLHRIRTAIVCALVIMLIHNICGSAPIPLVGTVLGSITLLLTWSVSKSASERTIRLIEDRFSDHPNRQESHE